MAIYYNGHKVKNLYFNGKCITRLALGKEMTRLVEGDDFVRAEWLKGDGMAYINTNHKLVSIEDRFDIKYRILDDGISGISKELDLFGYTDKSFPNARNVILTAFTAGRTFANYCYATNSSGYFLEGLFDGTMQLYADTSNMHRIINGIELQVVSTNGLTQQQMGDVYLFDVNLDSHSNHPFNGGIAYFKISDASSNTKMNLIPCRLLRPIPATLDANGIARNAGDCGMYDTVSGKFYGNVANSGTFSVEGMIEGVDYEVHQWLRVYMPVQQVGIWYMALPLGSANFSFRRKYVQGNNCPYIQTNGYVYYTDGVKFRIWSGATTFTSNTNLNVGTSDYFQSSESALEFNEESIPIYGYPALTLNFVNASTSDWYPADAEHLTSLVTVDGIERYIPVKLLKSIPSKYDANGIARQAGECGMYDTVNDKFYGNVANSGKFTVSD